MATTANADKVLERKGTEITNKNGSAFNWFLTGNRDGIMKDYLNECKCSISGNSINMGTGAILICGFTFEILSIKSFTISSLPSNPTNFGLFASVTLGSDGSVSDSLMIAPKSTTTIVQQDIHKIGQGTYMIEVAEFIVTESGIVSDSLVMIPDIISGGVDFNASLLQIGNVTSSSGDYGTEPVVDIDSRYEDGKYYWDFQFVIPEGKYTLEQEVVEWVNAEYTLVSSRGKLIHQSDLNDTKKTGSFYYNSTRQDDIEKLIQDHPSIRFSTTFAVKDVPTMYSGTAELIYKTVKSFSTGDGTIYFYYIDNNSPTLIQLDSNKNYEVDYFYDD